MFQAKAYSQLCMTAQQASLPKSDGWDVPIEVGAILVISYMALRLWWQQAIFLPYAFVLERVLFLIAVLVYAGIRYRWSPGVLLGSFRLPERKHWMFVAAVFAAAIAVRLLFKVISGPADFLEFSLRSLVDECFIPPLNEEPVFRGVVMSSLIGAFPRKKWGLVVLSALIFTVVHRHNFVNFIPLMALGICSGMLFLRTRSLTVCMLLHCCSNAVVFIRLPGL